MSHLNFISLFLSGLVTIRSLFNLFNLQNTLKWLIDYKRRSKQNMSNKSLIKFYVCIPVLYEQATILKTIDSFINQNYPINQMSIYIVTTAKETSTDNEPTTKDVVEDYIKSLNDRQRDIIHVLNYPKHNGHMAHQINFVAKYIKSKLRDKNAYFVVYNADSHIGRNTISTVANYINDKKSNSGKHPTILQQSALYQCNNCNILAEGAGLHQTLWTLVHEIPRLRKQSCSVNMLKGKNFINTLKYCRVAHCVGHGLFVHGIYYNKHPLPQDILNEDLPYGLKACALREPIFPIPSLELASTPSKIKNVYLQKSTWFNPFFEFLEYGQKLFKSGYFCSISELFWLIFQNYVNMIIWLAHTPVLIGGLITSLLSGSLYFFVWFFSFVLYWVVPSLIITRTRRLLINGGSNSYVAIPGGIPYVLTHSLGPFISIFKWLNASAKGIKPMKRKTGL